MQQINKSFKLQEESASITPNREKMRNRVKLEMVKDGKTETKVMPSRERPVASALRFSSVTLDLMLRHCRTST